MRGRDSESGDRLLQQINPGEGGSSRGHVEHAKSVPSYTSLYGKKQLAFLGLARLAEPLAATSIQSYMFYQLRYFNPSASDATISSQAGFLVGAKTIAQVSTGIIWGRIADTNWVGRKIVLTIGLLSAALCCIGYGLSRSFASAVIWQVVGGSMNSNISMVRCVVAEMYPDKRYRVRALTLLPLCANVGLLLGPLLGGLLSSQADMKTLASYPYLLPNLTIAVMYIVAAGGVIFGVEETLLTYNRNKSLAQMIQRLLQRAISRPGKSREYAYSILDPESSPNQASEPSPRPSAQEQRPVPPAERNANTTKRLLSRVCSSNVFFTMLTHFIISGHLGTFNTLWSVFLSAHPEQAYDDDKSPSMSLGGGLGLQPRSVGITMSILGAIIVFLQIVIYPRLSDRFGTLKVWRVALYAFPIAYFCAPFPAFYASRADSTTSIIMEWVAVAAVLLIFGIGRTGVTPATTMLINDCAPDSSVRATVHSMATVLGNLSRSIFPVIALVVFGFGLKIHLVGLAFWCLTGLALLSCVASRYVRGSSRDAETA